MNTNMHIHIYTINKRIYRNMYLYTCVRACVYIYIPVYVFLCECMYMCVYTYNKISCSKTYVGFLNPVAQNRIPAQIPEPFTPLSKARLHLLDSVEST